MTSDRVFDETVESLPKLENCGRYLAQDNKGQWHYINHAGTWQGCPPPFPDAPTPGGDNRIVAWLMNAEDADPILTANASNAEYGNVQGWDITPLVPLSQLQAVERERDEARQLAAKLLQSGQEDLILLQEVAGTTTSLRDRLETAEASLAAAREAQTRWHDEFAKAFITQVSEGEPRQYFIKVKFKTMDEMHLAYDAMATLAALAGSNGE